MNLDVISEKSILRVGDTNNNEYSLSFDELESLAQYVSYENEIIVLFISIDNDYPVGFYWNN